MCSSGRTELWRRQEQWHGRLGWWWAGVYFPGSYAALHCIEDRERWVTAVTAKCQPSAEPGSRTRDQWSCPRPEIEVSTSPCWSLASRTRFAAVQEQRSYFEFYRFYFRAWAQLEASSSRFTGRSEGTRNTNNFGRRVPPAPSDGTWPFRLPPPALLGLSEPQAARAWGGRTGDRATAPAAAQTQQVGNCGTSRRKANRQRIKNLLLHFAIDSAQPAIQHLHSHSLTRAVSQLQSLLQHRTRDKFKMAGLSPQV